MVAANVKVNCTFPCPSTGGAKQPPKTGLTLTVISLINKLKLLNTHFCSFRWGNEARLKNGEVSGVALE